MGSTRFLLILAKLLMVGVAAEWLSPKILAVLAGALCGVMAAIPTAFVINSVIRHRAAARQDRLAWCKEQGELSELRAQRLETLSLSLPAHRHQLVVHAQLDRQMADLLAEGYLDAALKLGQGMPELPDGMGTSPADLIFALPTSTWPGEIQ